MLYSGVGGVAVTSIGDSAATIALAGAAARAGGGQGWEEQQVARVVSAVSLERRLGRSFGDNGLVK